MGQLKPGASYIYEKADGVTYARESGAPPQDRVAIGMDYPAKGVVSHQDRLLGVPITDLLPFVGLINMARDNPELKEELDRLITFYHLSAKNDKESVMWHPV